MRRPALLGAFGAFAVVALFLAVLATRDPALTKLADSPLLGRAAPAIESVDLDGDTVRLSQFRGRYTVVNFFATWCVPCIREHPELLSFARRHADRGDVQLVQVIFDDDPGAVRRFVAQNGVEWPVLTDPNGKVALEFGVRGPPESYLIGRDGTVLMKIVGEVDADGLDRLLRQVGRA